MSIGKGVSPVGLDMILSESISTAMPSFRIVDDISPPGFNHSGKHIRIFGTAYTFGREHFGIMTTYMVDYPEGFARFLIDKTDLRLFGKLVPELEYKVA